MQPVTSDADAPHPVPDGPVLVGEVHTAILRRSAALRAEESAKLVDLVAGEPAIVYHRPIAHVRSPSVLVGVDCRVAGVSGASARTVGTVACRATLTGGRIVQGSSSAQVCASPDDHRWPWSTYLTRPGTLHADGSAATVADLGSGFVAAPAHAGLNLAAVSGRMVSQLVHARIDSDAPLRTPRTQLCWYARIGPVPQVRYTEQGPGRSTVQLEVSAGELALVRGFCEDLALHEWLLGCLSRVLDGAPAAGSAQQLYRRLRPLVDHIVHLWMPVARPEETLAALWERVDRASGMTRQWRTMVGRVRDQLTTTAVALLEEQDEDGGEPAAGGGEHR